MTKADTAGRRSAQGHQAGDSDTRFRNLADHDALQDCGFRVPQQIDRMLAVGIILRPGVVGDPLATGERADDAKPVNPARET